MSSTINSPWQLPNSPFFEICTAHPLWDTILAGHLTKMWNLEVRELQVTTKLERYRCCLRREAIHEEFVKAQSDLRLAVITRWNEEDPDWKGKLVAAGRDVNRGLL